ncbi:MAG TPA: CHRD domain-containing protein, partial [Saprospiraceae bacterium]|nr:CHRD domain-containing protein [Saprospiraceae bacterium]
DLYVNVHTTVHPSGEIRGQISWMAELIIPALLSGVEEVPPVSTDAVGLGAFRFSQNLTSLQYEIKAIGLSGPITGCHIHQAAAGADGPVIADLGTGPFVTGTITDPLEILTILLAIANGEAYVNIHTDANPGGEIRAQLGFDAFNNGGGILNGDQENPPVTTSANGYGYAALQFPNLDTLYYAVVFEGITPTNAHIHRAPAGMNGPIVTPLTPSGIPDTYLGFVPLNDLNLTAFLKDELYFNIHSSSFPGGEIRGQITNNLMKSFAFDMCSDQVVPAKTLPAYGAAYAAVNKANTEMEYGLMVEQFNGDAVTTQVREGSVGMNGALLLSLENPIPYAANVITLPPGVGGKIDIDRAYVSIHTAANPSGEVRGQVRRGLSCKINVGTGETAIREIRLKQNLVSGLLELEADSDEDAEVQIRVTNASGQQTKSWNRSFFAGTTPVQLEVDDLVSGLYFLQVQEKNQAVKSFKFVKP